MGRRSLLNTNPDNNIDQILGHMQENTLDNDNDNSDFDEIEEILSVELKKRLSLSSDEDMHASTDPTTSSTRVVGDSPTVVDNKEDSLFNPRYLDTAGVFKAPPIVTQNTRVGHTEIPFDPLFPIEIDDTYMEEPEGEHTENEPLSKVSTNEMFPIDWSYRSPTTKGSMWSYENYTGYVVSRENSNDMFTFDNVTTVFGADPHNSSVNAAIAKTHSPSGMSSKPRKSIFSNIFEENSSSSACTEEEEKMDDARPHTEPAFTMENTINALQGGITNPASWLSPPQVLNGLIPATAPEMYPNAGFTQAIGCINAFPLPQPQPPPLNSFYNLNGVETFVPVSYPGNHFSRHSSLSYEPNLYTRATFNQLSEEDIKRNYDTVVKYFGEPTAAELDIKNYYKHLDNNFLPKLTYPIEAQGDAGEYRLVACCFKNARLDVFYISNDNREKLKKMKVGDLVIVEADRGKDLGKVVKMNVSVLEARLLRYAQYLGRNAATPDETASSHKRPVLNFPKLVLRLAKDEELLTIDSKIADEVSATEFCQAKIREYGLQLSVVDAEYQWDMKKLTFYYLSDLRIDFRDLVKDLFRTYKIRIWMSKKS